MKKIFLSSILLIPVMFHSQNIKCEIADYIKELNGKEYFTYQYVKASYSYSRSFALIVTSSKLFSKINVKVPKIFNYKQEYTDVYILGIKNFNREKISNEDNEVIRKFVRDIIKYRSFNNLPINTEENILKNINYLKKEDELCKILICRK